MASAVIMCVSEPIEFMERTERPLALDALDRAGETLGSSKIFGMGKGDFLY